MAKKSSFYILAGLASVLWDPNQKEKENQLLMPGKPAKDLTKTPKVKAMIAAGSLAEISEDEYKESLSKYEAAQATQEAEGNKSNLDHANEVMRNAEKAQREAESKLQAAELKLKEAEEKEAAAKKK